MQRFPLLITHVQIGNIINGIPNLFTFLSKIVQGITYPFLVVEHQRYLRSLRSSYWVAFIFSYDNSLDMNFISKKVSMK